jgi:hypothetical protein
MSSGGKPISVPCGGARRARSFLRDLFRRLAILLAAAMAFAPFSPPVFPADITLPGFDGTLKDHGVTSAYTRESSGSLVRLLEERMEENGQLAAAAKSQDEREDLLAARRILEPALVRARAALLNASFEEASPGYEAFVQAKRLLYAYESRDAPKQRGVFYTISTMAKRLFRSSRHAVPNVEASARTAPIGIEQARREASCLVDEQGRYVTRERMASMGPDRIAGLDLSESNLAYYTNAALGRMKSEGVDPWRRLERTIEESVREGMNDGVPYRLEEARRVLFFDEATTRATSPKINVWDAYGKRWRIKWGNSIQTEAVAARLYVRLGGKYTDLVYANGPSTRSDLVLVLEHPAAERPGDGEREPSECAVRNADELADCLRETHDCDLRPWISSTGVLTPENVNEVLSHLPRSPRKEYQPGNLIGRHYVLFKESLVEFRDPDGVVRVGANALSTTHAAEDRAVRGGLVFHMWINNVDTKDENNTTALLEDGTLVESPEDLGGTFARSATSAISAG